MVAKTYRNPFLAYGAFLRRGFTDWRGRSSRSEFWWSFWLNVLIILCVWNLIPQNVVCFDNVCEPGPETMRGLQIFVVFVIFLVFLSVSMMVRRWRDAGASQWWWLLSVFPLSGLFWVILINTRTQLVPVLWSRLLELYFNNLSYFIIATFVIFVVLAALPTKKE